MCVCVHVCLYVCVFLCDQACDMDSQCGGAMCCAVSLWIRSVRMCTPMGQEHDDCHPLSHKVSPAYFKIKFNVTFICKARNNWSTKALNEVLGAGRLFRIIPNPESLWNNYYFTLHFRRRVN